LFKPKSGNPNEKFNFVLAKGTVGAPAATTSSGTLAGSNLDLDIFTTISPF